MFIAIHPTTYRGGGFLAQGVLKAASVALDYSVVENKGVVAVEDQVQGKWVAKSRFDSA